MTEAVFKLRISIDQDNEPEVQERNISGAVIKSNDEQRYVLMVAYPSMKADKGIAQDGFRDFGSAPVVEAACFNFMRKGCKLGMWHKQGYEDCGEVVENYIYRGPTWVTKSDDGTEQVIEPNDWLVGMILTPEVFEMYKAGIIGGASPQGRAKRRIPDSSTLAQLRS